MRHRNAPYGMLRKTAGSAPAEAVAARIYRASNLHDKHFNDFTCDGPDGG